MPFSSPTGKRVGGSRGSELLFFRIEREYKTWELMAADVTGTTRKVFAETAQTFVGQPVWVTRPGFQLLKSGNRFLWLSERDGWAHACEPRVARAIYLSHSPGTKRSGDFVRTEDGTATQ